MKAMILEKPASAENSPLRYTETDDPIPSEDEITIKIDVCGVCHTDLHIIEGELTAPHYPLIPGHQIVGRVESTGKSVTRFKAGDKVGVPWLNKTCGSCRFCKKGLENLCEKGLFTGFSTSGGFAEKTVVHQNFAYKLPKSSLSDEEFAPLLCGGVVGYRAFVLSGTEKGDTLALVGFGASAHIVLQVAHHAGAEVIVFTRNPKNRKLALDMGATWAGGLEDTPPKKPDRMILFAPAGKMVPMCLEQLSKGGTLALAGIYMDEIPPMNYEKHLYYEKTVRSVANSTKKDVEDLLSLASEIKFSTKIEIFELKDANKALIALKQGTLKGAAAVLKM